MSLAVKRRTALALAAVISCEAIFIGRALAHLLIVL